MNILFSIVAITYWLLSITRIFAHHLGNTDLMKASLWIERIALFLFTTSIIFYVLDMKFENGVYVVNVDSRPISLLLFTWSLNGVQLFMEISYALRFTTIFTSIVTALFLTLFPRLNIVPSLFTNDLEWLSFHRIFFLLGYSFCLVALPVVIRFLWFKHKEKSIPAEQLAETEREIWRLDRMVYRAILCALPLLTIGLLVELLITVENGPGLTYIDWQKKSESLLALATWSICGLYLHTRLFFGWQKTRLILIYLCGFGILCISHIIHTARHS